MILIIIILIILIVLFIYQYIIRPHRYWINKGLIQSDSIWLIKDHLDVVLHGTPMHEKFQSLYNYTNGRYYGTYQFFKAALVLRDPELIKQLTVKDFDHFLDHRTMIPDDIDPLWSRNLFALTGEKWKEMRSILSPVFTSSKMKQMFVLMRENAEQLISYFQKQDQDTLLIEAKDTFTRFTNDVIANTAFGLKCDSLEERDNEFYLKGKDALSVKGFWKTLTVTLMLISPALSKLFNLKFIEKNTGDFFTKLVADTIANREKEGIVRPDLINILMEARKHGLDDENEENSQNKLKSRKIDFTDVDITAQALIFFFAGFDSVANLMCFMAYELALNPDVQEKLFSEIDEVAEQCDGEASYDDMQKLKYLDMVISETLRKWPNAVAVDRICTKPYTLQPMEPHEESLYIEKDISLLIPIYSLHHDPQYFSEPERFDPERFSEENRSKIQAGTYIPFGTGPRNCIGSRFALLETKILFFSIIRHFELTVVKETEIPLQISKAQFSLTPENGIWLGLKKRNF